MNNQERYILYEGIHLSEPSEMTCTHCQQDFTGRWWWTPDNIHVIVCQECAAEFERRDDDAEYSLLEQLSLCK